ncbi:hypothetical protein KJ673_01570 [Patescibacteria group bacterium]|nr:hypothetical protein [Patescibacteria group bacterium]MCG2687920.1 hypothetical protein [Candidatus Parcubacteria bacterium]
MKKFMKYITTHFKRLPQGTGGLVVIAVITTLLAIVFSIRDLVNNAPLF